MIGEDFIRSKVYELIAQKSENKLIDSLIDLRTREIDTLRQIRDTKKP